MMLCDYTWLSVVWYLSVAVMPRFICSSHVQMVQTIETVGPKLLIFRYWLPALQRRRWFTRWPIATTSTTSLLLLQRELSSSPTSAPIGELLSWRHARLVLVNARNAKQMLLDAKQSIALAHLNPWSKSSSWCLSLTTQGWCLQGCGKNAERYGVWQQQIQPEGPGGDGGRLRWPGGQLCHPRHACCHCLCRRRGEESSLCSVFWNYYSNLGAVFCSMHKNSKKDARNVASFICWNQLCMQVKAELIGKTEVRNKLGQAVEGAATETK